MHVGDELADKTFELLVDLIVGLQHLDGPFHIQAREGVERLAQLRHRQVGFVTHVAQRQAQAAGHAGVDQPLHRARDARRLVAHALEVGNGLGDGHQQPQVASGRLAPRDDGPQVVVDLDFHRVDTLFGHQDLGRGLVAQVGQRVDRLADLGFDQAAHLEHARGDAAEFGVELG
jgi:hypothetical protein